MPDAQFTCPPWTHMFLRNCYALKMWYFDFWCYELWGCWTLTCFLAFVFPARLSHLLTFEFPARHTQVIGEVGVLVSYTAATRGGVHVPM